MSFWPGGALQWILDPYIQSLVLFWLIAATVTSTARLKTLVWTLAICAVPLALTGLRNYATGVFVNGRAEGYAKGLASNPNDLALMMVVILPLTVSLVGVVRSVISKALLVAIALLQIATIITTFSRGGFIALIVVLGGCLLWQVRQRALAPVVLAMVVLAAGATLLPTGYGARLSTIADYNSDPTGSAQARWSDTLAAVQFIERHPLVGAGVGLDYLALNEVRGETWESVHNAYLKAGVDLGLLGMVLYVLLLGSSLITARRAERDAEREGLPDLSRLAGGARIALLAFIVGAFFYPIPYHPYFYLLAGIALAARGILWEHAAWEPHDQPSW
jgi:O-antigen ligase